MATLLGSRSLVLAACLVLAGCGQPTGPRQQAEDLGSIAAEGALLAHDAAAGSSTGPFTRVHSDVLRDDVGRLATKLEQPALERIAGRIAAALDELPDDPAAAERQLADAAEQAKELAN